MNNPLDLFRQWRDLASADSGLSHPAAMCVSTVDATGAPDARFVDLKAVRAAGFVFCTSYRSRKSAQIEANPRVGLTFWWNHAGRQVRVLGSATRIGEAEADQFFRARSRDAQLAAWAFEQSAPLSHGQNPGQLLDAVRLRFASVEVPRPDHWGGYLVSPHRMEFLSFDVSRAHRRVLYELHGDAWAICELQP